MSVELPAIERDARVSVEVCKSEYEAMMTQTKEPGADHGDGHRTGQAPASSGPSSLTGVSQC